LGDRSSVNPRGDFHTDNVTSFEDTADTAMDVDLRDLIPNPSVVSSDAPTVGEPTSSTLSADELYPVFWTLQQSFSNPPRLFKDENFAEFKKGLELTLNKFKDVPTVSQRSSENNKGTKRKGDEMEGRDEFASTFNPKYLTSRDLFSLEVCYASVATFKYLIAVVERLGVSTTHTGPSFDITGFPALPHRQSKEEACTRSNTKSIEIFQLHAERTGCRLHGVL
jgi:hypothetical protein